MQSTPNGFPPPQQQNQTQPNYAPQQPPYQPQPNQQPYAQPGGYAPQQPPYQQPAQQPPPGSYLSAGVGMPTGMPTGMDQAMLDKIVNANPTANGNYPRDGEYLFAIKDCKVHPGFNGKTFVVNLIVIASSPQHGAFHLGGVPCDSGTPGAQQVEPNPVGDVVDFTARLEKDANAAGNVKAFVLALTGTAASAFNSVEFGMFVDQMVTAGQPVRGALIACRTVRKANQGRNNPANKGKILVLPNWAYASSSLEERGHLRRCIEEGKPLSRLGAPPTPPLAGPAPQPVVWAPAQPQPQFGAPQLAQPGGHAPPQAAPVGAPAQPAYQGYANANPYPQQSGPQTTG